jgi:hypothetical protein
MSLQTTKIVNVPLNDENTLKNCEKKKRKRKKGSGNLKIKN